MVGVAFTQRYQAIKNNKDPKNTTSTISDRQGDKRNENSKTG